MQALFLIALLAFQGQAADADDKKDDKKKDADPPAPTLGLAAPVDAQKCYTGDVTIDDKKVTMPELMKILRPLVGASLASVASSDKGLQAFLESRGSCQADCLGAVLSSSVPTLYGKLGEDFVKPSSRDTIVESVTGAIRACYPSPPRADLKKVAQLVVEGVGKPAAEDAEFPEGVTCENDGEEAQFPMDDLIAQYKEAFQKVVEKKPKVLKFFQTEAKDCQMECLSQTVPPTVLTLFLTNNDNKGQGIDALTGAMHACFPSVPPSQIRIVVQATVDSLENATATATTRLYNAKKLKLLPFQGSFFPMVGIAAASCLLLFFAGVAMGRRSKRHSQVYENDEAKDLIANEQGLD